MPSMTDAPSRLSRIAIVLATYLTLGASAYAQDTYPSKPVRLVVPYPPGAVTDSISRIVANELGKVIGRGGRIAKAIRTALTVAGSRHHLRVSLDIEALPAA